MDVLDRLKNHGIAVATPELFKLLADAAAEIERLRIIVRDREGEIAFLKSED